MTVLALDHVQIAAPSGCEDDARGFFGDLLGLRELPKPETLAARGGVWFACGRQELHVGVEEAFAPARKAHPAFAVGDLDALRERLARADVAVRDDESIPGLRRFYADDPFGNRLEFVEAAA
ncbi:MAG TPA: VOC family protein [Gaiellaceae bacterium]|jgi:catechol 2,3-dioxygenase-like lactoylglutathione lyase family enzyme